MTTQYSIDDLLYLMQRLRDPETGCPWDLKQKFSSIAPHTIEETYEVVDAIEREDWPHLQDELGDLLFQVIFYAQLGYEQEHFDWSGIVDNVVRKLLRRHPHVFPDGTLHSTAEVKDKKDEATVQAKWEAIKEEERRAKEPQASSAKKLQTAKSILNDIPNALPGLLRAQKLQKRAAGHGFDWPEIGPVIAKIEEEIVELREQIEEDSTDLDRLTDELGDVLFCCVNLARFIKVNPEQALRHANRKFIRRFQRIESILAEQGRELQDSNLEEMDNLWDRAKAEGL